MCPFFGVMNQAMRRFLLKKEYDIKKKEYDIIVWNVLRYY